jgi:hypothetical protein
MQVEQGMHVLFTSMLVLEHVLRDVKEHAKNTKPCLIRLPVASTILIVNFLYGTRPWMAMLSPVALD